MKLSSSPSIGVAIITYNAEKHLPFCLPPFLKSPLKPRVLVVNSSSSDNTVEIARNLGAETLVIPRAKFNHGLTRDLARKHLGTDIVVMATPDAYLEDENQLNKLIAPLIKHEASIAYARQLPHRGADFFEAFHREFNYPAESQIRSIEDVAKYGVYTYFCSNSCAAYINAALDQVGGFSNVLIGEDTLATAKLLRQGHHIAYVADAIVYHSHGYSLQQEFKRHFDTGLARESYKDYLEAPKGDISHGKLYVTTMLSKLVKEHPTLIPYALIQTLVKLAGYSIGRLSVNAPHFFKKALSAQDFYWNQKL